MKIQKVVCVLSVLSGFLLAAALIWLTTVPSRAASVIYCVNKTGTGCSGECSGCYASVQAAINAADSGNEIRIAGGTYTETAGTVAVITKELRIYGGFAPDLSGFDPDMYHTLLDAQWKGSVVSITNAGSVWLLHMTLTRGDGKRNYLEHIGCGGGIYVRDTTLFVGNSVITNNVGSSSGGGMGGGLCALDSDVEVWDSKIISNTASSDPITSYGAWGGGMYVESCGKMNQVSLRGNQFLDNAGHVSDGGWGGGIYVSNLKSVEIMTNTIRGNQATLDNSSGGWGGGLYVENCSDVTISGNRIEENVTHLKLIVLGQGGGAYLFSSDAHLSRNVIDKNTATEGGGIFIRSNLPVTLSNNLIVQNTKNNVHAAEYYSPLASYAVLVNNTIVGDGQSSGVGADYYAILTLTNNIISSHATGIITRAPFTGTIIADHNLFWNTVDPITGSNAILQNPLLGVDYRLNYGSPAIDAGLNIPWLIVDRDGRARPQGSAYDIGAFEGAWYRLFLPLVFQRH